MTARDEAIDAVLATGVPHHKAVIAEIVNSIPNDVLVRLAIERGALEPDPIQPGRYWVVTP